MSALFVRGLKRATKGFKGTKGSKGFKGNPLKQGRSWRECVLVLPLVRGFPSLPGRVRGGASYIPNEMLSMPV